jgi:hypothetical protein
MTERSGGDGAPGMVCCYIVGDMRLNWGRTSRVSRGESDQWLFISEEYDCGGVGWDGMKRR